MPRSTCTCSHGRRRPEASRAYADTPNRSPIFNKTPVKRKGGCRSPVERPDRHWLGKAPLRVSWETHYVGDLRANRAAFLDGYLLKVMSSLRKI